MGSKELADYIGERLLGEREEGSIMLERVSDGDIRVFWPKRVLKKVLFNLIEDAKMEAKRIDSLTLNARNGTGKVLRKKRKG